MANNSFGKDLTTGSIPRHLLSLALPMLLGNLINTGYSIVNTIWVGRILGENAVAASAISFPVMFILIGVAAGATIATSIMVSQAYGAKNFDLVRRVVDCSLLVSASLGIALTTIGIIFGDSLLKLMNTPAEVFPLASPYFRITMLGFPFMYLSFLLMAIMRGVGDTKTPLLFMTLGVVINAILDPLLIIGIGPFPKMGLNGAAWASVFSGIVSLAVGVYYLNRKSEFIAFHLGLLKLDREIIAKIFKIGLPSMIQQTLVSMGSVFITTFVNGFGAQAIAAFGVAARIDGIAFMPTMSLMMATTTIAGQNLGAGKPERIKRLWHWGLVATITSSATIALMAELFPYQLLGIFLTDPQVISIGARYLRIVAPSYVLFAIMFISNGIINGSGRTLVTMMFTLLSMWVLRVPLAGYLSHTSLGISGIWFAIDISLAVVMVVSVSYYYGGAWKKPIASGKIFGHKKAIDPIVKPVDNPVL